jgi:hypothetical protein
MDFTEVKIWFLATHKWILGRELSSEVAYDIFCEMNNHFLFMNANLNNFNIPKSIKDMMKCLEYKYNPVNDSYSPIERSKS